VLDRKVTNRNGNGHAFFQFNGFMAMAATNNLTAIAEHKVNCDCGCNKVGLNESNSYFFGDYFSRHSQRLDWKTVSRYRISLRLHTDTLVLYDKVASIMHEVRTQNLCNVALVLDESAYLRIKPSEYNISTPGFRAAFNSQHGRTERLQQRWLRRAPTVPPRPIRVVVHIRRGEVYNLSLSPTSKVQASLFGRMTPVRTYLALARQVVSTVRGECSDGGPPRAVEVFLAAEAATVLEEGRAVVVPDLEENNTIVRLERDLPGATWLSLTGSENVLEAFEAMCFADIVIGSRSGFTGMAAFLCEAPLFVAMPFWISYKYVPNVVVVRDANTTHGEFTKFKSLVSKAYHVVVDYALDDEPLRSRLRMTPAASWCDQRQEPPILDHTTKRSVGGGGRLHDHARASENRRAGLRIGH